jgi:chromosomal replication initiator protein
MLAMWLARKYTRAALSEIGEFFGRSSHSTVISAQRRVEKMISQHSQIEMANRPCPVDEAIRRLETALRTA